ncbi:PREDICTED: protein FAR1-RELATED SEQUENCE 5-like [Nelumbo nucifera]|uniref:Protein FAR1-RELATED SEQUENCE n=1 Tax=Nelumbo nucifera TaxID=4432 RepID=A0A1U8A349_NELNU|nr:PREDICTED: protein FAR1-RELATED SEQUENCE 5-like [Nelumbo nucifera]XP_010255618.1 PREDICTED: protein FAR1-RELATED SEQUENCE 5-like [Nelumbo nucifera]
MGTGGFSMSSSSCEKNVGIGPQSTQGQEPRGFDLEECHNLEESSHDLSMSRDSMEDKSKRDWVPEIGIEFETVEDAYSFYNEYAGKVGFSIRKHNCHKKNGIVHDRTFCCSSEGHRAFDKRRVNVKNHRPETRTGCLAHLSIVLQANGKYRVNQFEPSHNHPVVTPEKAHFLRSQKRLASGKSNVTNKSNTTMGSTSGNAGDPNDVCHTNSDIINCLTSKRMRTMEKGDAGAILEYFDKMQPENTSFFHSLQLDVDDKVTNIFWIDAKMVADYGHFGDVVCLNTTYRINKDSRPFASFIGVNHHKQAVIFGAALLYDETVESFVWLFKTFLKAMFGNKPKTILTDQYEAISRAVALVLPETCHRFCVWHVYQTTIKQLSNVFSGSRSFETDFSKCIFDCEGEEEFLATWENMIEKCNLRDNSWLQKLFREKEEWALVYGHNAFCADINSIQRSENINCALRGYLNSTDDLLHFFKQFERLVGDWRYKELKADFTMSQSTPHLRMPVQMLKHAVSIYTPAVFEMFEKEYLKGWDCDVHVCGEIGTISIYKVRPCEKSWEYTVTFDTSSETIVCSCKKFEFVGILCGHALKVLDHRNIRFIPSKYIIKRWTKDAKAESDKEFHASALKVDSRTSLGRHYQELYHNFIKIAEKAAKSEDVCEFALDYSNKLLQGVEDILRSKNQSETPITAS